MMGIWNLRPTWSSKSESRFSSRGVGAAGATSTSGRLRTVNFGAAEEHAIPADANEKGERSMIVGAYVRLFVLTCGC